MYARFLIGELTSEEELKEFGEIYEAEIMPALRIVPGFLQSELLIEEGGRMILVITLWKTRGDCLTFHSSRTHRQMIAKTQHLLVGEYVVKLFRIREAHAVSQTQQDAFQPHDMTEKGETQ